MTASTIVEDEYTLWQGNVTTRVRVAGDGPPLVFLHGATGLVWDPFLDALAETHRVHAPMHPGTDGRHHDAVRALRSVSDLVLCYAELFDTIGLEHAVLVGHSFGGMVAAEFAASYPRFVDKLVLISSLGLWRDDAPVANWMMLDPVELLTATFADPAGPAAVQTGAMFAEMAAEPEAMVSYLWALACTGEFVWPLPDRGLSTRMHRIRAPALVVWGREDGIVSPVYADEFGARLCDAQVEVVDGAGHIPQLEQLEVVGKLVQDFLCD